MAVAQPGSIFKVLSRVEIQRITDLATVRHYAAGELIFAEGDAVDYIYFIEAGQVSISIRKFTTDEVIGGLGPCSTGIGARPRRGP